jgi:GntR family transcriptional regulator, phosphonate transport system regulatory protein
LAQESLWSVIAAKLTQEIAAGHYRPGDKLPTEAALATRFGVNRHTVRRALASLSDRGLVHSRQGAGVFVAQRPTVYPLGRRVRFHQNVLAAGQTPSRRISHNETRPCNVDEAKALRLRVGDAVNVVEGVSLADNQPIATFRSVFPATRFPSLIRHLQETQSITLALAASGLTDYTRAETRLTAQLADPVLALALGVRPGAPVLRTVALNIDPKGVPVEYGTTWFSGERVTFTVADQP